MVSKLFYFFGYIFGIIIFTNGNPTFLEDSLQGEAPYDIKKFLEVLLKQINKDLPSDHYENYQQRNNQKDLTYIDDKTNEQYKNEESDQGLHIKMSNYLQNPTLDDLNLFLRNSNVLRSVETKKCQEKSGTCSEVLWNDTKPLTASYMEYGKKEDNIEKQLNSVVTNSDVHKFINNVDKTLKLDGNTNVRCYGNGCKNDDLNSNTDESYNKYYNDNYYYGHLRCNGKSCNINREDGMNNRGNLRCYGNRCDRSDNLDGSSIRNVVGSYKDIAHILRSCINNSSYRNGMDTLRCIGNRCNKDRDNDRGDRYNNKVDKGRLRCIGDICGINRDDDDKIVKENDEGDRYDFRDDRYDIGFNRNKFRCIRNGCGRSRGDDTYTRVRHGGKDERARLRCFGNRCVRVRDDNDRNLRYNDGVHTYTDISYTSVEDGKVICYGNKCIKGRSR